MTVRRATTDRERVVHAEARIGTGVLYFADSGADRGRCLLETWGPVGEVIGLWLHTAESRAEWTRRLIRRVEQGAFRMAGEH